MSVAADGTLDIRRIQPHPQAEAVCTAQLGACHYSGVRGNRDMVYNKQL